MQFVLQKTLVDLGKKGAFYRSPEKLAVGGHSDRRLRCKWPETPAHWVIGQTREFGPSPGMLRTLTRGAPHLTKTRQKEPGTGDSGQRVGDSGPSPGILRISNRDAPHFGIFGAEAGTPETPVNRAGDSGQTRDSGFLWGRSNQKNRTP